MHSYPKGIVVLKILINFTNDMISFLLLCIMYFLIIITVWLSHVHVRRWHVALTEIRSKIFRVMFVFIMMFWGILGKQLKWHFCVIDWFKWKLCCGSEELCHVWSVLLYCCLDCPSWLADLNSIGWATSSIWAAVKKIQWGKPLIELSLNVISAWLIIKNNKLDTELQLRKSKASQ